MGICQYPIGAFTQPVAVTRDQTFGWRIRQARRRLSLERGRDVTQADIAELLGVTSVTVARWESDVKSPDYDTAARLAAALGVAAGWLVFGEGAMERPPLTPPKDPVMPHPDAGARKKGKSA